MANNGDEIWTEEEVIEFGLAGEEEYCDLETVGTDIELAPVPEMVEVKPYTDDIPETNVTKYGRVRKKSAKLIEMEEVDELEKSLSLAPSRSSKKGRRGQLKSLGSSSDDVAQLSFSDESQPLLSSDRSIKVRFSLPPNTDLQGLSPKSGFRKERRRKSEMMVDDDSEFGESLLIDEPTAGHEKLRLKLAIGSDDLSSPDGPNESLLEHLQRKGQRLAKNKGGIDFLCDKDVVSLLPMSVAGADSVECDVTAFSPGRKRLKKTLPLQTDSSASNFQNLAPGEMVPHQLLNVKQEGLMLARNQGPSQNSSQMKKPAKPKKKRQKGYTAYMLWCNTQRNKLTVSNPELDFSAISKRLGDMWQTVPEKEKATWRRKARRLSKKGTSMITTSKVRDGPPAPRGRPPLLRNSDGSRPLYHGTKIAKYRSSPQDDLGSPHFKVAGTGPLDAAAHLKLLGESLTVIGARLQEHRGQIAVQGSLSVLLDSMLCALGPLMCLTSQVPELNCDIEQLNANTLDNIAYIMPGVG